MELPGLSGLHSETMSQKKAGMLAHVLLSFSCIGGRTPSCPLGQESGLLLWNGPTPIYLNSAVLTESFANDSVDQDLPLFLCTHLYSSFLVVQLMSRE